MAGTDVDQFSDEPLNLPRINPLPLIASELEGRPFGITYTLPRYVDILTKLDS
jgi:hypothetical protein